MRVRALVARLWSVVFAFTVVTLTTTLLSETPQSTAWAATSCSSFQASSSTSARYCLQTPDTAAPDALILFLHGLGGDERTWQTYGLTRNLQRVLEGKGLQFAVLTPSFGSFWLLKETVTPSGEPALLPVVEELLENTLSRFRPGLPVIVVGTSLGGFNAMQFYFKRPERLHAVALAGPAIVDASPIGNEDDIVRQYVERTRAKSSSARTLVRTTRNQFTDQNDFDAHDPLALALRREPLANHPPLLLQVGHEDHFGFQTGTSTLAVLLRLSGAPTEFVLLSGGRGLFDHVEMDVLRTASFLERSLRQP